MIFTQKHFLAERKRKFREEDPTTKPVVTDTAPVEDFTKPLPDIAPVEEGPTENEILETESPITTVLNHISSWKDELQTSFVYDACVEGAEILNKDKERSAYKYITKVQYKDFQNLIKSCEEIVRMINGSSFEAKKILEDISLARKMLVSENRLLRKK
jgi:hypothetical protein